eukprot:CAMPEP_0180117450 /NCGR_PEP_ID=MMETSP0986-20121125/926_1 /TAXON_ID=697907 /ORGANISM="non described non described, Strain CCMP2293" /LENGTH=136 /DNA_ID=CAMNT_0022056327 /DNA_START=458 /DNA_END=865 /DNA_ORIENTATION=+
MPFLQILFTQGSVKGYVGRNQNLKDLKEQEARNLIIDSVRHPPHQRPHRLVGNGREGGGGGRQNLDLLFHPEGQEKSGSDAAEEDCAPDDPRELARPGGAPTWLLDHYDLFARRIRHEHRDPLPAFRDLARGGRPA